jgi:hypothetical protein
MERFIDSSTNQHLRRHRNGQTTDGHLRVKTNSRLYHGKNTNNNTYFNTVMRERIFLKNGVR